jgi:O-antigen ligase
MFSDSVILYGIEKLILKIKDDYRKSYIGSIIDKLTHWFINLLNRSLIIQFLTSQIRPEDSAKNSSLLTGLLGLRGIYGLLKKIADFIIGNSLIINFMVKKDINFVLFVLLVISLPLAPTSLGLIISWGIIVLTLLSLLHKGSTFKYPKLYLFFFLSFMVTIVLSQFFNTGPAESLSVFIVYMTFTIMGLLVPYVVRDQKRLYLLLNSLVLTTIFLGLYGFYQYIFGAPMDEAWLDKDFSSTATRVYSFFGNPNVYGEYLVMVLPIIFSLFYTSDKWIYKIIYLGVFAFGGANVLMTLSRGSMLSLAIAMVILVILAARDYLPALIVLGLAGSSLLPESIIRRILSIFAGGDTSTNFRWSIYQASFNMLEDYRITGTGLGQFKELYKIYSLHAAKSYHAHNTLLMIYIEMGILGLISFIAMMTAWTRDIMTTIKYKKNDLSVISISIFAGLIGCTIQGMVDHIWHNFDIMLMYFILLGLGSISALLAKEKGEVNHE